jgi:hypothetical protein
MPIFPYWLAVAAGGAADDGSIPRNPAGCGPPQPLPRHFSLYVGDMGLCGRSADWDLFVFITSRMYSRWSCASNSGPDATVDTWPGWPRRVLASCPGAARSSSRPRPTVSRRCRCLVRARCGDQPQTMQRERAAIAAMLDRQAFALAAKYDRRFIELHRQ